MTARNIAPATGKLGVLTPGMGAVASTFIAGVIAARKGLHPPIGSISQMAHIRLGTKEENRNPKIKDFVPLADLDDIVFGGWDPISPNAMEAARTAGVTVASPAAFAASMASTLAGNRIVKVEPSPTTLVALRSPPIIWQKRRLMASPRPVPP